MTMTLPRLATAVSRGADPRVLRTLGMEGVSLALWDRTLPEGLAAALDGLPRDRLPSLHRKLATRDVAAAVHRACDAAEVGDCAEMLACEVEALVRHAVDVLASPLVELRLDVDQGRPSPDWHIEALSGRLLCPLRGPGPEYGLIGPDGAPQSIHRMTRGAVGIFRGVFWPARELAAIVHRMPPRIDGEARLTVLIDPVDDAGAC